MNDSQLLFDARLPDSWALTTMGEIAEVVGGSTPKSKEPKYWGGPIPWLAVSDLTDYVEKYISGGARTITQAGYESCATRLLPAGSVVFSSRAPIGYVAITTEPMCTSQGFRSFVPSPSVSPEYLYWYLKAATPLAEARASGTTFKEISGRAAKTIPIPIPPRAEQDRIIDRLETLDAHVQEGKRSFDEAVRLMDQFDLAILHAGFSGRLTDHQDEWERAKIGDVADQCLGKMLDKAKNRGEPRPYLRNVNVQWGRFELDDVKMMRIEDSERARYGVEPGDLLVCEGGEPGRCAVWQSEEEIYFQKALHRVRPGPSLAVEFLQRYLAYAARIRLLDQFFTGTTIKHLPGEKLREVPVPLPSLATQAAIVAAIDAWMMVAHRLRRALEQHSARHQALQIALIQSAVTGRLVPQDPADERASDLLRRVRSQGEADLPIEGVAP